MSSEEDWQSYQGPMVRSLSMSRNMAFSVVDEVQHMIRIPPPEELQLAGDNKKRPWWKPSSSELKRSSSTSSLAHLRKLSQTASIKNAKVKTSPRRGSDGDGETSRLLYQEMSTATSQNEITKTVLSSQNLPPIVKGIRRNDLLIGIVVSRWDNIVGPQSVYLWTEELTSVFYPINLPLQLSRLVKYVTDHTVDHQTATGRYIHPSVQRTTLCIVPDLELAYFSISIRVPNEMDTILEFQSSAPMTENSPDNPALTMPHSISVLYNLKYFNQCLLLRPLVISWLLEFGPQTGVLLCKDNLQGSMINSWCAELCKSITAIQTCWAQDTITSIGVADTSSNSDDSDMSIIKCGPFDGPYFESNVSYLPPNIAIVPKSSLGSILTSHLSTFSSSIIVGHDCNTVNQIIRFLLCFSTAEEGYCSRYSLSTLPDTFMKGLFVQGLILGGIGEKSISHKQVATNRLPLSKVDLGSKIKVRQTSIALHTQEREMIIMQELNKLWTSAISLAQPTEAFPTIVKDVAGFVNQFLNELELLPPERRYGRLLLFRRMIYAKAVSLITFLYSIQYKPLKERSNLKQLLPQILGFTAPEYVIVQVTAEKIRPGVMALLFPENV